MDAQPVPSPVSSAAPWLPRRLTLPALVSASKKCEGCELFMAAIHPSALLRMPEAERREEELGLLIRDLSRIPSELQRIAGERQS